jgi:hypothetical protein
MTIFFKSRTLARAFNDAKEVKNGKVVDHGSDSAPGRRWGYLINRGA